MPNRVRVNLANALELLELPGLGREQAEAIVRYRTEHGPIRDATELAGVVRGIGVEDLAERLDFAPADTTAPEAPGA